MFRATRSPSKIFRTGPRTVAACRTGSKEQPSERCQSTLEDAGNMVQKKLGYHGNKTEGGLRAAELDEDFAVKNGTPARIPWAPSAGEYGNVHFLGSTGGRSRLRVLSRAALLLRGRRPRRSRRSRMTDSPPVASSVYLLCRTVVADGRSRSPPRPL